MFRTLLVCTWVALWGCSTGPTAPDSDELGVLFIGNSLTVWHDLPG